MLPQHELILGDNPFFGVNHMQGSQNLENFEHRASAAAKVVVTAIENGFSSFMITAGTEADRFLKFLSNYDSRTLDLPLALVLPNPHFINTLIAERGFFGALLTLARFDKGFIKDVAVIRHGLAGVRRFILLRYLRAEIRRYNELGFKISHLCLHNIVVDLFLGLDRKDLLGDFIYTCTRLNVQPVLITQNGSRILNFNELSNYILCLSYNRAGYMVNPNLHDVLEAINKNKENFSGIRCWAMQIFASGAVSIDDVLADFSINSFDGLVYATTKSYRITNFRNTLQGRK